jgi:DNA helicase-2/ATP-dependent DNA helicase PcrA
VRLEQNYRSSGTIVAAANGVIDKNTARVAKRLFTDKDGGDNVDGGLNGLGLCSWS